MSYSCHRNDRKIGGKIICTNYSFGVFIPVTRRVKGYTRFVGKIPVTRRVKGYTRFVGKYTGRRKRFRPHKVYIFLIYTRYS